MGKNFPTLEDQAYVALFKYLFEVYFAETVDNELAFCRAVAESARAEIKRPELLEMFGKKIKDGGFTFPGRKTKYDSVARDGVRKAGAARRGRNVKQYWEENAG